MSSQPVVVAPSDRPQALKVVGEGITVLADGATTGSYGIFRQAGPEGSGPPPHNHPWDEAFYVIAGQVTFGVGARPLPFQFRACGGSDLLGPVRLGRAG